MLYVSLTCLLIFSLLPLLYLLNLSQMSNISVWRCAAKTGDVPQTGEVPQTGDCHHLFRCPMYPSLVFWFFLFWLSFIFSIYCSPDSRSSKQTVHQHTTDFFDKLAQHNMSDLVKNELHILCGDFNSHTGNCVEAHLTQLLRRITRHPTTSRWSRNSPPLNFKDLTALPF